MNTVFIDGFLTADPEKRRTQTGKEVTSVRLVHRDKPDDPGMFLGIVAWDEKAEELAQYKKGQLVNLFGRLSCHSWTDRNNQKRVEFEVVLEGIVPTCRVRTEKPKIDGMAYAPQIPGVNVPAGHPRYDAAYDIPGDRG